MSRYNSKYIKLAILFVLALLISLSIFRKSSFESAQKIQGIAMPLNNN
jgi:hypothetical protein